MRPVLLPAARRLWRDRQTLQLRQPSSRAAVLGPLDDDCRAVLALLDGTRSPDEVLAQALAAGCSPARAAELLDLLGVAGLLLDGDGLYAGLAGLDRAERDRLAPDLASLSLVHGQQAGAALAARRGASVQVHGGSRVGAPLAALLAAAGVGRVTVRDDGLAGPPDLAVGGLGPADLGRRRGTAATALLSQPEPDPRRPPTDGMLPDLVVLTQPGELATAEDLLRLDVPHLVALVREDVGQVGPLVLPGRSACLRCLDLVRTALDPGWPALAVQLDQGVRGIAACDSVLAVAVAAQGALQVLELLDRQRTPASVGGTLELELPGWRWRRRAWPQHPECPCAWLSSAAGSGAWLAAVPDDPRPAAAAS